MSNVLTRYNEQLKVWSKQLGGKPTAELLETAHCFGRPGKQSLALAMAMRAEGVTAGQIIMACGAPQNNHRRDVIAAGWFKRDMNQPESPAGHTVYKINLTPKGEAEAKKRVAATEATALPGDKPKPAKAKAKGSKKQKAADKKLAIADLRHSLVLPETPAAVTDTVEGADLPNQPTETENAHMSA